MFQLDLEKAEEPEIKLQHPLDHWKSKRVPENLELGFPGGSEVKASACNAGDLGSIPGSGRSPGEENGNPLQYSCLENPMDGGAWWATVHGIAKSQTRLSDFTFTLGSIFWFLKIIFKPIHPPPCQVSNFFVGPWNLHESYVCCPCGYENEQPGVQWLLKHCWREVKEREIQWFGNRKKMLMPHNKSESDSGSSCPTLCNPMEDTVHGVLQARILE